MPGELIKVSRLRLMWGWVGFYHDEPLPGETRAALRAVGLGRVKDKAAHAA